MQAVTIVTGRVTPLYRSDIDTDQIMPKQFLKRVERTGFGEVIFYDWRQDAEFILNDTRYAGSSILVSGPNFGTGSSREHAPWGLQQHGFRVIIAPSFADIFSTNCTKIGLLVVPLPAAVCQSLAQRAAADPSFEVAVDLPGQTVSWDNGTVRFDIDSRRKKLLVEGLDEVSVTLDNVSQIQAYEASRQAWLPRIDVSDAS